MSAAPSDSSDVINEIRDVIDRLSQTLEEWAGIPAILRIKNESRVATSDPPAESGDEVDSDGLMDAFGHRILSSPQADTQARQAGSLIITAQDTLNRLNSTVNAVETQAGDVRSVEVADLLETLTNQVTAAERAARAVLSADFLHATRQLDLLAVESGNEAITRPAQRIAELKELICFGALAYTLSGAALLIYSAYQGSNSSQS